MNEDSNKKYAYLPEDLLVQMLQEAPETAKILSKMVDLNDSQITWAREILERDGIIQQCPEGDVTDSIMAADGANIIEHKTGSDILLSIAVWVDGLSKDPSRVWPKDARQYQQYQAALPHHVANSWLAQGIMFLMELSILSEADRDIRIMDGSHLTSIIKLNSLLSAKNGMSADIPYVESLGNFLRKNYNKIIPDIPDIIRKAFSNDSIIGLTKYSSSRELIDSVLASLKIHADDKIFMSSVLNGGEYTIPMPVWRSRKERATWEDLHIICNLTIPDVDNVKFTQQLRDSISSVIPSPSRESDIHFCFYKPFKEVPAYRLEIKWSLAGDKTRLEKFLRSIRDQIVFPDIREPYPQYLADIVAKNITFWMEAVNEAIFSDPVLTDNKNFDLIFPYRT